MNSAEPSAWIENQPDYSYFQKHCFSNPQLSPEKLCYQIQLSKSKKEIDKLWEQISTWNTMVAMKLLEIQDIINKLNENKNKTK